MAAIGLCELSCAAAQRLRARVAVYTNPAVAIPPLRRLTSPRALFLCQQKQSASPHDFDHFATTPPPLDEVGHVAAARVVAWESAPATTKERVVRQALHNAAALRQLRSEIAILKWRSNATPLQVFMLHTGVMSRKRAARVFRNLIVADVATGEEKKATKRVRKETRARSTKGAKGAAAAKPTPFNAQTALGVTPEQRAAIVAATARIRAKGYADLLRLMRRLESKYSKQRIDAPSS